MATNLSFASVAVDETGGQSGGHCCIEDCHRMEPSLGKGLIFDENDDIYLFSFAWISSN